MEGRAQPPPGPGTSGHRGALALAPGSSRLFLCCSVLGPHAPPLPLVWTHFVSCMHLPPPGPLRQPPARAPAGTGSAWDRKPGRLV